jgi:anti-sigma-K factor RskA
MSELDYTDALAAEYVLGTLDLEERTRVRTLLDADQAFAANVELWERRFGELHLMVEPVEPEAKIWARIKAKMSEVRQKAEFPEPDMAPPAPAATAAEPPSLDAIEAAISQATTTLTSEAAAAATEATPVPTSEGAPVPPSEGMPVPPSEGMPVSASEATPTPASEATPAPASEATPTPASEATPALTLEATSVSISHTTLAPTADATPAPTSAVEPESSTPVVPPPAADAVEAPSEARAPAVEPATAVLVVHRRMRRWRAFAILMTLVVAAVAALLAAWRFLPDRVPPMLQPVELMRQMGVALPAAPAPRRPAPPGSQFDE